jgi:FAD/FMN-containing dehydrogenase
MRRDSGHAMHNHPNIRSAARRAYLGHTRDAGALSAMRAIKRALDPSNVLNPGKFLERSLP